MYYYDATHTSVKIQFPTWTTVNGQDDIKWYDGTKGTRHNCNVYYCTINKSNHNNETGVYNTHIYEEGSYRDGFGYTVN